MSWSQHVAELLNATTWIHLVFLFAVLFLLVFRDQVSSLISRTRKIGKEGLSADPVPEKQQEKIETNSEAVQKLLNMVSDSHLINNLEESIYIDLEDRNISDDTDKVKVLVNQLAVTQTLLAFEIVYSLIFGSQIILLEKINEVRAQGMETNAVNQYFDQVKATYPEQLEQWSSARYLKFLLENSLIHHNDGKYYITESGTEFLIWLTKNGRSKVKLL